MGNFKAIAASSMVSLGLVIAVAAPAFACNPQGKIVKKVQDITSSSDLTDANTTGTALSVKTGDILTYVITVSNAQTNDDGKNDMVNTVLSDTLPDGVTFVSNPTERTISENIGTLKPNQSVTKQYQVKVTATTAVTITNKACYDAKDANSKDLNGCDVAAVKIAAPTPVPTPVPTPPAAPTTPATPAPPAATPVAAVLPSTGPSSTIVIGLLAIAGGYIFRMKRLARQAN